MVAYIGCSLMSYRRAIFDEVWERPPTAFLVTTETRVTVGSLCRHSAALAGLWKLELHRASAHSSTLSALSGATQSGLHRHYDVEADDTKDDKGSSRSLDPCAQCQKRSYSAQSRAG